MSRKSIGLPSELYDYLLGNSLRESPVLTQLRRETAMLPGAQMQIAPEQGQFMALLCELLNARKTLEIGTYTGYSTLAVAEVLPANGKIIACDIDPETSKVARRYWEQAGVSHKIDLNIAPALETLDKLIQLGHHTNTFDFAFIDADKINNENYYERSLQLVRQGGLIAIDNVFRDGEVCNPDIHSQSIEASRAFNRKLHHDSRISLSVVPIADGLALARKR